MKKTLNKLWDIISNTDTILGWLDLKKVVGSFMSSLMISMIGYFEGWTKAGTIGFFVAFFVVILTGVNAIKEYWPKKKNKSKFEILFIPRESPYFEYIKPSNPVSSNYTCRFAIKNTENKLTIKNIKITIEKIEPEPYLNKSHDEIYSFPHLPINLRYSKYNGKSSDHISANEFNTCKDLSPNTKVFVDVLQCEISKQKSLNWVGFLTTNMYKDNTIVQCKKYDIKILITSDNGGSKYVDFKFDPNQEEENMWVMK
jgi:hypothetical protein